MQRILKKIVILNILFFTLMTSAFAVSLSLVKPSLLPAPLDPVELNGQGDLGFSVTTSAVETPAVDVRGDVNVEFTNIEIRNNDLNQQIFQHVKRIHK